MANSIFVSRVTIKISTDDITEFDGTVAESLVI
jgi:hypothetical protein